jgi:lipoprotein-anchoring transpeptidase ErfK/SrfK
MGVADEGSRQMRANLLIAGAAATAAVLSACGSGNAASGGSTTTPPTSTSTPTSTSSSTVVPTTVTTPPAPPPAPPPTTTSTTKPTPKTTTSKPKPKPPPDGTTPCSISDGACVDLSANKSWLLSGGKVSYGPVGISHGRKGWRTPPGTFRVTFKDIDHKSSIFDNAPMPYSVFFNGGIAFHQGDPRQQSHGCIRMPRAAAKTYYNTLKVGDTVQVVP